MQTIIYGYIEHSKGSKIFNMKAIKAFKFDTVYPFKNTFNQIVDSYQNDIISFATIIKANSKESQEWINKFQDFLKCLNFYVARVNISCEEEQYEKQYEYLQENSDIIRVADSKEELI